VIARRGSTLALVLWTLVVVGGISLGVTRRTRAAIAVASNARAQVVARYAAESGIALAVQAIEDSLGAASDSSSRAELLNALTRPPFALGIQSLGDARVQVALEDVNAKLDLNHAEADAIAQLLAEFGEAGVAYRAARAIRAHIGTGVTPNSPDESFPIGQRSAPPLVMERAWGSGGGGARYLTSLDELMSIPEVDQQLIERAAPYLTVDGDGATNRITASAAVSRAARGALVEMPSRLLLVSRGWLNGSSLTHEIQAVYAVQGNDLALVRWRERTR
jgi:type II secretory pathway component PulK